MVRTIIRHQWLLLLRDRRARWGGLALAAITLTAFVAGSVRTERQTAERARAAAENASNWDRQGVVDPHGAAHFGHFVFKPVSPLAALDPGTDDHLGTMVRLEAHRQHAASALLDGTGAALASFPAVSPAFALQVFAPVLLILVAFGTFAGEGPRQLLRQELAGGVRPGVLLAGRFLAYAAGVGGLLMLGGLGCAVWLALDGAAAAEFARLGLWLAGYGLYLIAILALALGISARCRSAPIALVSLVAFWALAMLVAPRLAPSVAAALYPLPSAPELDLEAGDDVNERLDRGQNVQTRPERLRKMAMDKYGVARIEDLPVNLSGLLLEYAEEQSTAAYREHFAAVYRRYAQQDAAQLWFAWLSPLPALRAWSAAMAGTDVAHHRHFLEAAENYRHAFVQALNRDILQNRPAGSSNTVAYKADVAKITAGLGTFAPSSVSLRDVWARAWPGLAALTAWAAAMTMFAASAARKLARLT